MQSKNFILFSFILFLISCTPTYIVTFSGSSGGTVSDIGGEFDEGTVISVTAQPDTGYEFREWSDGSSQNPRSITVIESLNLTALFSKQQFAVLTSVQGEGTIQSSGSNAQGEFEYGANARFEAIPSTGWRFDYWDGDISGTTNPVSVSINAPISVRAVFKREKFDLNITVIGQGEVLESVVVQPGQYDYETQVKLTAVPETGWEFSAWSGDLASTENPVTITVEEVQNITATFIKLNPLSIINGVTVKAEEFAVVGDVWDLNGKEYTIVNDAMLRQMVANDADLSRVVTSKVVNMNLLFNEKTSFNGDISSWDVSNVTNMGGMFRAASLFNGDISNWDVSKVTTMHEMFGYAESFNQNLASWDVSSVTDFERMFSGAKKFNQEINNWDISKATSLNYMFSDATNFNKDLNSWNTSNIKSMIWMFSGANNFNGDISNWDVSNVETMSHLFGAAHSFNQDISSWDVSSVINMQRMFSEAKAFNQDISSWDVSSVINMDHMFYAAQKFNQPLDKWCVTNIEEQPDGFRLASILESNNLPIWGACPLIDDDDNDGVVNYYDLCPGTEEGAEVNQSGCAENQIDNNNDGIPDSLEGDSDSDGVIDYYDECSNTTPGAPVDSKGCAVVDQVFLFSGTVSTVVVNNNVTGTISFSIRNNLDEPIQLESLKVYDGDTGVLRAAADRNSNPNLFPSISPGQSHSLQSTFNSFIYLPIYYWRFTYKGQVYEVSKRWSFINGQSRPPKGANGATVKEWDKKVVSFQLVNK